MSKLKISSLFFAVSFILLLYLIWLMAQPILGALIFGAILAGSFYPLFIKLHNKIKLKREITSVIMCVLIFIMIFVPLMFLILKLSKETILLYQILKEALNEQNIHTFLFGDGTVATLITKISKMFNIELNLIEIKAKLFEYIQDFSGVIITLVNEWVGDILSFIFDFIVMILTMYALFTEGHKLKPFVLKLSPLPDEQEELIIEKFNQMNYVTLVCNGLGGFIQGVLAGIGFWIAGISSVILWSSVMIILAFIPLVGISIVYIPVCIYLWLTGKVVASIILFIYCTLVALITENWFKPKFIGSKIQINSLFVLFCIIGGMSVFSMAGIFYGPLIGTVFLTAVEIYHDNYGKSV